jgi:hypothetical protein
MVFGIHHYLDDPDLVRDVEDFFPGLSPVRCLEQPALFIKTVEMSQRSRVHHIRILGIDHDPGDVVGVVKPHILPGLATINGFKDARPGIGTSGHQDLSGPHPHDVRIAGGNGDAADGECRFVLKDRLPGRAVVHGFPEVAGPRPQVDGEGLIRVAGDGLDSAALEFGSHGPPSEVFEGRFGLESLMIRP